MRIVKQRLLEMLLGVHVFLDVRHNAKKSMPTGRNTRSLLPLLMRYPRPRP